MYSIDDDESQPKGGRKLSKDTDKKRRFQGCVLRVTKGLNSKGVDMDEELKETLQADGKGVGGVSRGQIIRVLFDISMTLTLNLIAAGSHLVVFGWDMI